MTLLSAGFLQAAPNLDALKKKAENGDNRAAILVGHTYRDGKGVKTDYKEALKWYRLSADTGNGDGLDNVGFMHLRGWGVPENHEIAVAYFKASSRQGHGQGTYNLGKCYFSGLGTEQTVASLALSSCRSTRF